MQEWYNYIQIYSVSIIDGPQLTRENANLDYNRDMKFETTKVCTSKYENSRNCPLNRFYVESVFDKSSPQILLFKIKRL